jgi:AraC-like DNA-binding protein
VQQIRSQSHRPAVAEAPVAFDWQDQLGEHGGAANNVRQASLIDVHEISGAFSHWDDSRYRIFLPTKGAFAYRTLDGRQLVADAAHLFISAPDEMFDVEPLGRVDQFRGILLAPPEGQMTFEGGLWPRFNNIRAGARAAKAPLEALLLANRIHVLSSFGERSASNDAAAGLVAMAMSAPLLPRISRSSPIVDRLKVQLNETFHQRTSLTELAAEVGKSPSLLTQMFTRSQDLSFYQYQLKIRLSAALAGLFGRHNITEVAYDVGFSSHSHFSVQFRRAFGMSPSQCRLYLASL